MLATALIAWMVMRSVVGRMRCAIEVAETVARGDLSRAPRDDGNDELGRLMDALGNMVTAWQGGERGAHRVRRAVVG